MRGEHHRTRHMQGLLLGSSPRARGAHPAPLGHGRHRGIIPACAGSTRSPGLRTARSGDHPRVRGEHRGHRDHHRAGGGSSPRARGAQALEWAQGALDGIIPACAGSTSAPLVPLSPGRDHPRVRGEHISVSRRKRWRRGSSPRARGAPRPGPSRPPPEGIIPACAGSTLAGLRRS